MPLNFSLIKHSLFANECPLCAHETLNIGLCGVCEDLLEARQEPKCARCDATRIAGDAAAWCTKCIKSTPAYERAWGVFDFGGPARDLVNIAKFQANIPAAITLGRLLVQHMPKACQTDPPDRICPMPLHPKRVLSRGINVPLMMGAVVAKALRLPLSQWRLSRVRDTPPQRGLNQEARRRNVQGAFAARWVRNDDVLVIDDVFTTGATAQAASVTLRRAGCRRVRILTLAYVSLSGNRR